MVETVVFSWRADVGGFIAKLFTRRVVRKCDKNKKSRAFAVLKKLERPDMLIWAEGATVYIPTGEDKASPS